MNARGARRRLLAGALLAAGLTAATTASADAATTATFNPGTGALTVFGDSAGNTIAISRDATGRILVNGGAIAVMGGTPDRREHHAAPCLRPGRQ